MELKRNREIIVSTWINEKPISDSTWEVWSRDEGESLYVFVKDPSSGNQIRIKVEKIAEIKKDEVH